MSRIDVEYPSQWADKKHQFVIWTQGIGGGLDFFVLVVCSKAFTADVPLVETFGYATTLRSVTQGQGVFSMELSQYRRTPQSIQEEVIAERRGSQLVGAK